MLGRKRLRAVLLAAIAVLYVVAIPWYRDGGAPPRQTFGLPDWVTVALACYAVAGVLNAVAWLLTDVDDEEPR